MKPTIRFREASARIGHVILVCAAVSIAVASRAAPPTTEATRIELGNARVADSDWVVGKDGQLRGLAGDTGLLFACSFDGVACRARTITLGSPRSQKLATPLVIRRWLALLDLPGVLPAHGPVSSWRSYRDATYTLQRSATWTMQSLRDPSAQLGHWPAYRMHFDADGKAHFHWFDGLKSEPVRHYDYSAGYDLPLGAGSSCRISTPWSAVFPDDEGPAVRDLEMYCAGVLVTAPTVGERPPYVIVGFDRSLSMIIGRGPSRTWWRVTSQPQ